MASGCDIRRADSTVEKGTLKVNASTNGAGRYQSDKVRVAIVGSATARARSCRASSTTATQIRPNPSPG